MKLAGKDTYGYRLVQILRKLNQGQKLDPKALANEFGVNLRAIQRDLNERFAFLELEKVNGLYQMPVLLLGKLQVQDIERFASLAGVSGLFPSLSDSFLRELLHSRMQSIVLIKGHQYEDLHGKDVLFGQLEGAIHERKRISYSYQKPEGIKTYRQIEPYRLVNQDGIWYLAAKDGGKLKAFTLVKIDRLELEGGPFTLDPNVDKVLAEEDGIWLNEEKLEVVLSVTGTAAGYFRRRKWVPHQKILEELDGGGIIVSAKVAHINQILPTVRQWIPWIRIIHPDGLQAEMEKEIRSYLNP
jgi:predicted DNA-binding transcriptional regulator YafY